MPKNHRLSLAVQTALIALVLLLPGELCAEAVRLQLFGPGSSFSDIRNDARMSPDGEWAVARWDALTDGVFRLYAVRRNGSERHELSINSGACSVESFEISPDSRYVVYECERLSDNVRELRSVPISGPAFQALLSPDWTAGVGIREYAISPDSARVVLRGEFDVDNIDELWSAPIAGPTGAAVKLNPPPVLNGEVDEMRIAPDSSRVVFFGDVGQVGRPEYWSVPIAGPGASAIRLNPAPAAGAPMTVESILISPDSSRVVYSGYLDNPAANELWSVPLAGPAASSVKLNPAPVANGAVSSRHTLTPDGARVVFHGDLRVDERLEIWSVPIAGPAASAVRLSPTPVAGGEINNADPFLVSPDSTYLVMHGDLATDGASELWRVPIAGPAASAVKVNPTPVAGGGVGVGDYEISPNSARIVFSGDLVTDSRYELWSASRSAAAGVAVNLSTITVTPGDVTSFVIAGDSSRVVFKGDLVFAGRDWIYSRDIDGTGSRQSLSPELFSFPDADVGSYAVSADGRDVVYEANPDDPTREELYRRRVADGSDFQHLSGPDPGFTDADLLHITADSRGTLYLADVTFDNADQLWIADDCILRANFEEGTLIEWTTSVP